ncbi:MAG: hypothetical protein GY773_16545 [Actinomycetia bacterium]|nr:hypothetical protein [Actinomycetes bacterium]
MDSWPRGRSADGGIDEIPLNGIPGRLWLCGKHVVGPDPVAALARVDATELLCFNERHELEERYPDYVTWLTRSDHDQATWFPTPDLGVRPVEDFVPLVEATIERLSSGSRLIAHCGAGIGRTGTFAICTLLHLGHDIDGASDLVAANRPMAGPENGAQAELVQAVARHLRSRS